MRFEIVSSYGEPHRRNADVFRTHKGYYVKLYKGDDYIRTVECSDHSESYAENIAENWVLKTI
jgi:hypothetical protein